MALFCISLVPNDVEHLFICFVAIHMFSLVKSLLNSFCTPPPPIFCIGLFAFLLLSCRSSKVKFLLWFFWVPYEDTLMKDFAQSLAHNHASKEPNLMVDRSA